ncbi:MAG: leucine-rich repeat protein [Prevotella sp.]|nr:leucine-rich repeat protein [Prevotella sp.]
MRKLIIYLVMILLPAVAYSEIVQISGLYYDLNEETKTATVTHKPGYMRCYSGNIEIPKMVEYESSSYIVNSIGDDAFALCDNLTSCKMPNSIKKIGEGSFLTCKELTSIEIPDEVESIGDQAFCYCYNLAQIILPEKLTSIGMNAFGETAWYEKIYNESSDGVIYINKVAYSYKGSSPIIIEIKDGTLGIAASAFSAFSDLYSIALPQSLLVIGRGAFSSCSSLSTIDIPGSIETISPEAFQYCNNLASVILHEGLKRIEYSVFNNCKKLETINIPKSLEYLDGNAFQNCSELRSIHIDDLSAWCKIIFGESIPIDYHLYLNGSEITDLVIPNDIITLNACAFSGCEGIRTVKMHNEVLSIGHNALCCKNLTTISLSNNLKSIEYSAFSGTSLSSIEIPNSVMSIGSSVFQSCKKITSVILPKELKTINKSLFKDCKSLTSIIIPEKVEMIYQEAFANCALTEVKMLATNPPFAYDDSFSNYNISLYVPITSISSYQITNPWSKFTTVKTLTGEDLEKKKCAKPTISVVDGKLKFSCETEEVEYHYTVSNPIPASGVGNDIPFSQIYTITVYASKTGYENSDTAKAEITATGGKVGDTNGDGEVNAADIVQIVNIIMGE